VELLLALSVVVTPCSLARKVKKEIRLLKYTVTFLSSHCRN
jgi:hypothetical protein